MLPPWALQPTAFRYAARRAEALLSWASISKQTLPRMSGLGVRRAKAAFFSGCKSHPATIAPAGSNRSSHGGNEMAEASGVEGHIW